MAEEIGFENGQNSNFQGLVTLTLDPAIRHTVVHHSSTSTYIPNFIQIKETSVIFVLTYFLVLVAVFEIFFSFSFVLVFIIFFVLVLVLVFQLFLRFSLVSVLHYFFVSVFVFDFIMLK